MLRPVRTVPPAETPVSLDEAKLHCRVDHNAEDALITGLIAAAATHLDGWTGILGRALVNQTWRQTLPGFPSGAVIGLALAPVQSITSITYHDGANVEQTLAPAVYALLDDQLGPFVTLQVGQSWPATFAREDAVTVTYVAGYGPTRTDLPEAIRHAMLLLIGHWYEHREAVVNGASKAQLPLAVQALLGPFRRVRL
jgi:uncharacterized phiE125 gp8 family phage protein